MTTCIASATPVRGGWTIAVIGLPVEVDPFHSATLSAARAAVAELAATVTGIPCDTGDIEVYVESVGELVGAVELARDARARATAHEYATLLRAARAMIAQGLSEADAGELLGVDVFTLGLMANSSP
ncbi:hypothetical protein [Nocardia concava]|uniref:hypothetical protein n=1 Tax=Nocardia concava TaxID=257281 RepID=UPI00030BD350|nr:hypothetical protein [Nocardia concava]